MSAELETIKRLADKAASCQPWDLKPVLLALMAAIVDWMEKSEVKKNGE